MRLAWNKTALVLTVSKEEAFEIRKALPIPVSRYRLVSNRAGKVLLTPDGTGNELKAKPTSNYDEEALFQLRADSLENNLPKFWSLDIPPACTLLLSDGRGLVLDVAMALEARPSGALPPAKMLRIAGRGAPKEPMRPRAAKRTEFIPDPAWIEERMAEAEDETQAMTRIEALQQADLVILTGLLKRINGFRHRHRANVRFVMHDGYVGLRLASSVEIDCTPKDA